MWMGVVPLVVGLLGALGYTALRVYEVKRGSRFFETTRTTLDRYAVRLYRLSVFGEFPASYRMSFRKMVRDLTHTLVIFLVSLLRALERPLSRLNYRLRVIRAKEGGTPSPFLKQITPVSPEKADGEKPSPSVEST